MGEQKFAAFGQPCGKPLKLPTLIKIHVNSESELLSELIVLPAKDVFLGSVVEHDIKLG